MTISTVEITGAVPTPADTALVSGTLIFKLSGTDTEDADAIGPVEVKVTLSGKSIPAGTILWRNTAGLRGTYYTVTVRAVVTIAPGQQANTTLDLGRIQIGDEATYTLADLLNNPVPDEPSWNVNLDPTAYAELQEQLSLFAQVPLYKASIAEMKAIAKADLTNGRLCHLTSYNGDMRGGGGVFEWDGTATDTVNIVTIFASNEGGSGRWFRRHGGILTPADAGAVSAEVTDQSAEFEALFDAANADATCIALDLSGSWRCDGTMPDIAPDYFHVAMPNGGLITRLSSGQVIRTTGEGTVVNGVRVDGNGFDNPPMELAGNKQVYAFCDAFNTLGQGISVEAEVVDPTVIFCRGYDTGKGGIGIGKTFYGLFLGNRVWNTGAEGMPGDRMLGAMTAFNFGDNCGGVGFLGTDGADDCQWIGNLARNSHNGFVSVDHRMGGSRNLGVHLNTFIDNDKVGLKIKNDYHRANVASITLTTPCVVTFAAPSVTGVSLTNPCVLQFSSHGLIDGELIKVHSLGGTTQLNNGSFRVLAPTPDTLALYDPETFEPIDATGYTAWTSGGHIDHAFEAGDRIWFRDVGGTDEINDTEFFVRSKTNGAVTLEHEDGTSVDSTLWGVFTNGGYGEAGYTATGVSATGNIIHGSGETDIRIEARDPVPGLGGHVFSGNNTGAANDGYPRSRGNAVLHRPLTAMGMIQPATGLLYKWAPLAGVTLGVTTTVTFTQASITDIHLENPLRVEAPGHAREDGDLIRIHNVNGTVEVNGNFYRVKTLVGDDLALYDPVTGAAIDGTAFTPYTSAGNINHPFLVGETVKFSGVGGTTQINGTEYLVGARSNTTITITTLAGADVNSSAWGAWSSGGDCEANAYVRNKTGNGTAHTVLFTEIEDTEGSYGDATGIFTMARDGYLDVSANIGVMGAGNATEGLFELQVIDRSGAAVQTVTQNLIPAAGAPASSRWRGAAALGRYLHKGDTVRGVVTVSGLGQVVSLIPDGSCSINFFVRA